MGEPARRSDQQHRDHPHREPEPSGGRAVDHPDRNRDLGQQPDQQRCDRCVQPDHQERGPDPDRGHRILLGADTVDSGGSDSGHDASDLPGHRESATTESANGTGAFSAAYSGGNYTSSSSGNLGQTNTLSPALSYGPYAQVTAGGCSSCYYGQTGTPNSEGDAFVNGSLSGQLTIGTTNNLIIDGNITYNDCSWTTGDGGSTFCPYNQSGTNDSLGLIAENYAEIGRPLLASTSGSNPTVAPSCSGTPGATCDPSNGGNGITIDAAILALNQSFVVNNYGDAATEGKLTVYGRSSSTHEVPSAPSTARHRSPVT